MLYRASGFVHRGVAATKLAAKPWVVAALWNIHHGDWVQAAVAEMPSAGFLIPIFFLGAPFERRADDRFISGSGAQRNELRLQPNASGRINGAEYPPRHNIVIIRPGKSMGCIAFDLYDSDESAVNELSHREVVILACGFDRVQRIRAGPVWRIAIAALLK
ncbi:MAG TPA: hypothetical protein VMM77_10455 [Gemmatimonadaceae bacterium]|nr:hypothetical protein [Gemmatimonadaceae bacterium]